MCLINIYMEYDDTVTLESGELPITKSCEVARFHDLLRKPDQLVIMGRNTNIEDSGFVYSRVQTDMETFEDSTFSDMPPVGLYADMLVEISNEYGVDPLTTISCIEQMVLKKEIGVVP